MKKWLVSVLLMVFCCGIPIAAQENLTEAEVHTLVTLYYRLTTLDDLATRGILTAAVSSAQSDYYLAQASTIEATITTRENLIEVLRRYDAYPDAVPSDASPMGFLNFVNIVWFIASIIIVVALGTLFNLYILPLLRRLPLEFYEALAHVVTVGLMLLGLTFPPHIGQFIALPGVLGFTAVVSFSSTRRLMKRLLAKIPARPPTHTDGQVAEGEEQPIESRFEPRWAAIPPETYIRYGRRLALFLFIVCALNAVVYQSSMLGFIAIIHLEAALGFVFFATPLHYYLGFQEESVMGRAMVISLLLVVIYTAAQILGIQGTVFAIFAPGVYFFGTLVYFIGLLIVTSTLFSKERPAQYRRMQLLALVSGLAALFVGSVWEIVALRGAGGMFFFFYFIERYIELGNWRKRWVWMLLGLGLLLYFGALLIQRFPEFFVFW